MLPGQYGRNAAELKGPGPSPVFLYSGTILLLQKAIA